MYLIISGEVKVFLNYEPVEAHYDKSLSTLKAVNKFK